jgi:hypothetical protein
MEAIRAGVTAGGWELSGLQKTTSHQFEGRWEGESTRSAYLFFHATDGPDNVSIDVYLDETGQGLSGNLALVVDLVCLDQLGDVRSALAALARMSARSLGADRRRPVTLRLRLDDAGTEVGEAESEVRFKLRIPKRAIASGDASVTAFVKEAMAEFGRLLASDDLKLLAAADGEDPGNG